MEKEKAPLKADVMDKPLPLWSMVVLPLYIVGILAVALFPIAGDWRWLEGWLFNITFTVHMAISFSYINKTNPRVLRNRMKVKKEGLTAATKKSAGSDRFIMPIMGVGFFTALLLPGFAHRMGWEKVPFGLEIAGLALFHAGLLIMNTSMLQNAYASKILDINKGQTLIDSGLYARVRHPLYSGAILMIMSVPVALGSWWGALPAAVGAYTLVVRIKFEEEMLVKGMAGYTDYQKRVPYKLFPGIF
jgi:protein-S-isoprenylcysteine O-methyltransferase Ste14